MKRHVNVVLAMRNKCFRHPVESCLSLNINQASLSKISLITQIEEPFIVHVKDKWKMSLADSFIDVNYSYPKPYCFSHSQTRKGQSRLQPPRCEFQFVTFPIRHIWKISLIDFHFKAKRCLFFEMLCNILYLIELYNLERAKQTLQMKMQTNH